MADHPHREPSPALNAGEGAGGAENDVSAMHAAILREKSEPQEGHEPVPLWLVAFIGSLLFWGGHYMAKFSGGYKTSVLDTRYPTEVVVANPKPATTDDPQLGQRTYTANCAPCHQADGNGVPGQFPPLAGSEWVTGGGGRVIRVILDGLQGPIEVKGQPYNNAMPPWRDSMSDEQIAAVATYIRSQWGNKASAITAEAVTTVRKASQDRAGQGAWTAQELLAIPDTE